MGRRETKYSLMIKLPRGLLEPLEQLCRMCLSCPIKGWRSWASHLLTLNTHCLRVAPGYINSPGFLEALAAACEKSCLYIKTGEKQRDAGT